MSSKKERRRNKRRAEKTAQEAAEALALGRFPLAERLMLRALDSGPANARFWTELAEVQRASGKLKDAEQALQRALALSPGYAEAHDALAGLFADSERWAEAFFAESRAVELAGARVEFRERLESYRERAGSAVTEVTEDVPEPPVTFSARTERYDWARLEAAMVKDGFAVLPGLLGPTECVALRELFPNPALFEHEVAIDDDRGRLCYRFFRRPLPALVFELRHELYARAAVIANRFNELLGKPERFPKTLVGFAEICRRAGQRRTSPILLHYDPGGFNSYHRDVYGSVFFPFQCAVSLGPSGRGAGGEFALLDQRPGKKKHFKTAVTGPGDAVLFCTRDRLCPIAGLYGLQPVLHGASPVLDQERYALGLPFHDYAGDSGPETSESAVR